MKMVISALAMVAAFGSAAHAQDLGAEKCGKVLSLMALSDAYKSTRVVMKLRNTADDRQILEFDPKDPRSTSYAEIVVSAMGNPNVTICLNVTSDNIGRNIVTAVGIHDKDYGYPQN